MKNDMRKYSLGWFVEQYKNQDPESIINKNREIMFGISQIKPYKPNSEETRSNIVFLISKSENEECLSKEDIEYIENLTKEDQEYLQHMQSYHGIGKIGLRLLPKTKQYSYYVRGVNVYTPIDLDIDYE